MKLRNKLILSCAALAACATTMVSTTFAWYTSNTSVKAETLTGNSSATGSDSLLVSLTGEDGTWKTSVDISSVLTDLALIPVAYGDDGNGNGGGFYKLTSKTGETQKIQSLTPSSKEYAQFSLYFKNEATPTSKLYIKSLVLNNTTGAAINRNILNSEGFTFNDAVTKTYAMDMFRATNILVESGKHANKGSISLTKKAVLEADHDTDYVDILDSTYSGGYCTKVNARAYYNAFMSGSLTDKNPLTGTKKLVTHSTGTAEIADLANTDITQVQFTIFLNGWDDECFDACQGQKFTLSLGFTTLKSEALDFSA